MLHASRSAADNRLLTALRGQRGQDRQHMLARCEYLGLRFAEVLCKPGELSRYIFLPTDRFVCLIAPIEGHASLKVGLVGDEGNLGISVMLGDQRGTAECPGCKPQARLGEWRRRRRS